jgi:hypothetical protein
MSIHNGQIYNWLLEAVARSSKFLWLWVLQGEKHESDFAGNMRYFRVLLSQIYT